jgi:hypothetical protein
MGPPSSGSTRESAWEECIGVPHQHASHPSSRIGLTEDPPRLWANATARGTVPVAPTVDAGDHCGVALAAQVALSPWDVQSQRSMSPSTAKYSRSLRMRGLSSSFAFARITASSWLQLRSKDANKNPCTIRTRSTLDGRFGRHAVARQEWSAKSRGVTVAPRGAASEALQPPPCLHLPQLS